MRQVPKRLQINTLAWRQHGVELGTQVIQIVLMLEQENQGPASLGRSRLIPPNIRDFAEVSEMAGQEYSVVGEDDGREDRP